MVGCTECRRLSIRLRWKQFLDRRLLSRTRRCDLNRPGPSPRRAPAGADAAGVVEGAAADVATARGTPLEVYPRSRGRAMATGMAEKRGSPGDDGFTCRRKRERERERERRVRRTCKLCNRYIIALSNHEDARGFSKQKREREEDDGKQKGR